jgi:hypothetical protein
MNKLLRGGKHMNIYDQIAKVAYSIYEKNGNVDGKDLDDWLEAEKIVLGLQNKKRGEISEIRPNKKVTKEKATGKSARTELRI